MQVEYAEDKRDISGKKKGKKVKHCQNLLHCHKINAAIDLSVALSQSFYIDSFLCLIMDQKNKQILSVTRYLPEFKGVKTSNNCHYII